MTQRCVTCDRPEATSEEWRDVPEGTRPDLCRNDPGCRANSVDWRARALAAEADAAESAATRDRMRDILDSIAATLRGKPPENGNWGWADLPVHMARVLRERDEARAAHCRLLDAHMSSSDEVRRRGIAAAIEERKGWGM